MSGHKNGSAKSKHPAPTPGEALAEALRVRGMSASELARRCGRSPKLMVEILAGRAPVEPETAIQLSRVLGTDAGFWIRLEANYRLRLAEANERSNVGSALEWACRFPLKELYSRKLMPRVRTHAEAVPYLLQLFGAGTIAACEERFDELASVSYRHSPRGPSLCGSGSGSGERKRRRLRISTGGCSWRRSRRRGR